MVDVRLQQYVQEQLKKGYSTEQIRATLLQSGYTSQDIAAATPHSKILVIAALLCISIVIVFSVIFLLREEAILPNSEITGTLQIDSEIIRSGEPMHFTLSLSQSNLRVRYSVLDDAQREMTSKEELVQTSPVRDLIVLPHSLERGSYILTARIANTLLSVPFTIAEKGSLFRLVDVPEVPQLKNITDIAKKSADEASALCSGFADIVLADKCHLDAALATDNDLFCTAIKKAQQKDSCYFNIVFSTRNLELCQFIQNPDLEATCGNL